MTPKEHYDNIEENIDFTKLTNTGISTDYDAVFKFSESYLNEYVNWKRNVNINVDSYPEVVLIEMFKEDNL